MSNYHRGGNRSERVLHDKIARAVFAAMEKMGIADRNLTEQLVEEVIRRLQRERSEDRLPLPGMEEFVSGKSFDFLTTSRIESIVKETLAETGRLEITPTLLVEEGWLKSQPAKVLSREGRKSTEARETPTIKLSPNALRVLERRYLKKDSEGQVIETPQEMFRRVAMNIASAELLYSPQADAKAWEEEFFQMMASLEFLPNSPTLMNAGRELGQLSACFVLPIEDSIESIFEGVKHTALIHKSGGGTGFSFSQLRPENDRVGSTGGVASGPVSFARAFDIATEVIKQGGTRRGANMAILNVSHPDILKFISAKEDPTNFNNFNFSVAVTEEFMNKVQSGDTFDLINPNTKQAVSKLEAREVFDKIVDMAWRTGDPGIVFLDRINKDNPTPKLGAIESTNPCGEQPLLPYESCNLASINLAKMLCEKEKTLAVDWDKIAKTVTLAVKFLDNVIEVNKFPLAQIEQMTKATRKIGLGVMGFADMLIQLGIPYDSEEALKVAEEVMGFINLKATQASVKLAEERGTFPEFPGSIYDSPSEQAVRNACRTTIAPTGTLSLIANCSSGIEPLFALCYTRTILEGEQLIEVNPYFEEVAKREGFYSEELVRQLEERGSVRGVEGVPEWVQKVFATSHDISPKWHVKMQAVFQKYTDNAVSKTVNFPQSATRDDVAKVFLLAYQEGCKGITIYRDRSRERQVLSISRPRGARDETLVPRKRPKATTGTTTRVSTGCGSLYITINSDEEGICEVFSSLGKAGGCASAQLEAISRLISLALRSGIDASSIVKHLRGIRCPSIAWEEGHAVLSCPDAIGGVLEKQIGSGNLSDNFRASAGVVNLAGQCPECGSLLAYQEGCYLCSNCGYTKCG
jgi:ribonucleoside-diphosphate reductase alpha chain